MPVVSQQGPKEAYKAVSRPITQGLPLWNYSWALGWRCCLVDRWTYGGCQSQIWFLFFEISMGRTTFNFFFMVNSQHPISLWQHSWTCIDAFRPRKDTSRKETKTSQTWDPFLTTVPQLTASLPPSLFFSHSASFLWWYCTVMSVGKMLLHFWSFI